MWLGVRRGIGTLAVFWAGGCRVFPGASARDGSDCGEDGVGGWGAATTGEAVARLTQACVLVCRVGSGCPALGVVWGPGGSAVRTARPLGKSEVVAGPGLGCALCSSGVPGELSDPWELVIGAPKASECHTVQEMCRRRYPSVAQAVLSSGHQRQRAFSGVYAVTSLDLCLSYVSQRRSSLCIFSLLMFTLCFIKNVIQQREQQT